MAGAEVMDMCLDMGRDIAGMCVIMDRDRGTHISSARRHLCQLGAFLGVGAIVASFVPAECPVGGGGYVGYIQKALEKGYLEHPRSACCTDGMFKIFVLFGRCLCCLLPLFVNRQPPCPHTNSRQVLLHPQMHCRNLRFAKERALAGRTGCMLLIGRRLAKQKGLVQPVRSNLHATRWNTRFYPLLRPLRLQCSFGIKRLTPPRLHSMRLLQP